MKAVSFCFELSRKRSNAHDRTVALHVGTEVVARHVNNRSPEHLQLEGV